MHFEFNEKKQFNCLSKPVPYCLSDAKGRPSTINKMEALKKEVSILHRYYEPEMAKILQFLYPGLAVESFCQIDGRFHWLKYYLCDEQRWLLISSIKTSATENIVSTRWCILLCQTRIKTVLFRTDLYLKLWFKNQYLTLVIFLPFLINRMNSVKHSSAKFTVHTNREVHTMDKTFGLCKLNII